MKTTDSPYTSDYTSSALKVYDWLKSLQIRTKTITGVKIDDEICIRFTHPTLGPIKRTIHKTNERQVCVEGIWLIFDDTPTENSEVTFKVYDYGGVFDPIDHNVPGDHYAATHLAWLSALLWKRTKNNDFFDTARIAIRFHLNTWPDMYKFKKWGYHADFNVLGFQQTYLIIRDDLSENERIEYDQHMLTCKPGKNPTINWRAMRLLFYRQRRNLYWKPSDIIREIRERRYIRKAQLSDGCIEDSLKSSRPIQYHAYSAALLHRYYLLTGLAEIKQRFVQAAQYLVYFVDPQGCFNHKGRGQEQIFGYGCAIYVFEAARLLDPQNSSKYTQLAKRVHKHLTQFQNSDGHFPLVLNNHKDEERFGWYDYHHTTVYNAFCSVWLMLAQDFHGFASTQTVKDPNGVWVMPSSGVAIARRDKYYACLCAGEPEYCGDAGITFHHIYVAGAGALFTCPGGPDPARFGKFYPVYNLSENYFAPIFKTIDGVWIEPSHRIGIVAKVSENCCSIKLDYGPCAVNRIVHFFHNSIEIQDTIIFHNDIKLSQLRWINIPISTERYSVKLDKQSMSVFTANNKCIATLKIINKFGEDASFCTGSEINSANGMVRPIAYASTNISLQRGQEYSIRSAISF